MSLVLAIVAAYVVGSINFAVLVGKMHGVNIDEEGSGNPGASNILRTLGKGPAAMVYLADTLKGVIGAAMGMVASGTADPTVQWAFLAGLAAVVGHCYPIFHRFRGGKGVATAGGVFLFTIPIAAVIMMAVWAVSVKLTKTASMGSLAVMVLSIPLAIWQGVTGLGLVWIGLMLVLVLWRHRGNIVRMVSGNEQKVPT
jgi:acyl phosphate:glycerol-3-phosphate acyltransferase